MIAVSITIEVEIVTENTRAAAVENNIWLSELECE